MIRRATNVSGSNGDASALECAAERERLACKLVLGIRERMAERDLALLPLAQRQLGLHRLVVEFRQHR